MDLRRIGFQALAVLTLVVGAVTIANAQPQRTFVASFGNDANNCAAQTTPCRTFQRGHDTVAIDGEVVALDSGGYGTITITKGVTLIGTGVSASLTSNSFVNAITVAVAPPAPGTRRVVLRDLRVQGRELGNIGINVTDVGTLYIQDCTIERFTGHGIHWGTSTQGRLVVSDSTSRDNGESGLEVEASVRTRVSIDDSRFVRNGGAGIDFDEGNIDASISDSTLSENEGNGLDVSAGSGAEVSVTRTTAANNGNDGYSVGDGQLSIQYCTAHRNGDDGMAVEGSGTIRVGLSTSTNNQGYGFNQASGTFETPSFQRNVVEGNQTGQLNGGITTITPI